MSNSVYVNKWFIIIYFFLMSLVIISGILSYLERRKPLSKIKEITLSVYPYAESFDVYRYERREFKSLRYEIKNAFPSSEIFLFYEDYFKRFGFIKVKDEGWKSYTDSEKCDLMRSVELMNREGVSLHILMYYSIPFYSVNNLVCEEGYENYLEKILTKNRMGFDDLYEYFTNNINISNAELSLSVYVD